MFDKELNQWLPLYLPGFNVEFEGGPEGPIKVAVTLMRAGFPTIRGTIAHPTYEAAREAAIATVKELQAHGS
jgi:hypothetical protein